MINSWRVFYFKNSIAPENRLGDIVTYNEPVEQGTTITFSDAVLNERKTEAFLMDDPDNYLDGQIFAGQRPSGSVEVVINTEGQRINIVYVEKEAPKTITFTIDHFMLNETVGGAFVPVVIYESTFEAEIGAILDPREIVAELGLGNYRSADYTDTITGEVIDVFDTFEVTENFTNLNVYYMVAARMMPGAFAEKQEKAQEAIDALNAGEIEALSIEEYEELIAELAEEDAE
jgi:hypothetical protein